jgi:leucyl-tRNA synthetase
MLTAFAYKDSTGRLVPADEVEFDGETPRTKAGGEALEQVIAKMSKSLKNVVNPDDVCGQYGVDAFRLYEMFMGPLADSKPWNPRDVPGPRKFLDRAWRLFVDEDSDAAIRPGLDDDSEVTPEGDALAVERALNQCLQRVDDSFKAFNFNTAVAAFMEFLKNVSSVGLNGSQASRFVRALAPFAPHFAEEIWSRMGNTASVHYAAWPKVDERYLVADEFEMPVQVLGKLRGKVMVPRAASKDEMEAAAREAVAEKLEGKTVVKTIVVPGRLVNFVVK